jgi:thiamine-phosphate pyrophosphorylase
VLTRPVRCYITDRHSLPPGTGLLESVARNLDAGIEWIQIREKDLSARELLELTKRVIALPNPFHSKILVNTRIDVALAAGAAGAHLPAGSPAPRDWRAHTPAGFLIGVSCHSLDEVRAAEDEGADYAVFGPVFMPRSKAIDVAPLGIEALAQAARGVRMPLLALGGITNANVQECFRAGAAGVAAISLYQSC